VLKTKQKTLYTHLKHQIGSALHPAMDKPVVFSSNKIQLQSIRIQAKIRVTPTHRPLLPRLQHSNFLLNVQLNLRQRKAFQALHRPRSTAAQHLSRHESPRSTPIVVLFLRRGIIKPRQSALRADRVRRCRFIMRAMKLQAKNLKNRPDSTMWRLAACQK